MKHINFKKLFTAFAFILLVQTVSAQQYLFVENFGGNSDYPPDNADWYTVNNSSPLGELDWFLGSPGTFTAFNGPDSSYIAANYNSVDTLGTISNWLLTPELQLQNGNIFRFYTRSPSHNFADRMQVYLSTAGSGTNVGTTSASVGTFSTLLLDINPSLTTAGYPIVWTAYTATLSGIATGSITGRFGFRYYVTSGGEDGTNSDYIGLDSVTYYTPGSVSVGIKTIKANGDGISVYPNPFKNELMIGGTSGRVEIYDILGKLAVASDFESGKAINTGALEKGIYVVRITNDKNEFVKMQKINKE
jgi:hypothetical protein